MNEEGEAQIHWIAITNAFILDILLIIFVVTLLKNVVKKDLISIHDFERSVSNDEAQWKLIKNEVFYCPKNKGLFSAFIGIGTQFFFLVVFVNYIF